jgi:hypothetical protein
MVHIMGKYTLLRNNKQSGPHSLEELKEMGMKVYDLIWIEGRCAAWLYAEEVPELAPFTPKIADIVEESFLEKRATAKIPSILEQLSNVSSQKTDTTIIKAAVNKEPVCKPVNKIQDSPKEKEQEAEVNVMFDGVENLPQAAETNLLNIKISNNDSSTSTKKTIKKKKVDNTSENKVKDVATDDESLSATINNNASDLHTNAEQPHIKYSRSLDDIKQEYVSKVLTNEKIAGKKSMPVMALFGVAVLLLIGIGVVIGILLSRNSMKQLVAVQPKETSQPIEIKKAVHTKTQLASAADYTTKKKPHKNEPGNQRENLTSVDTYFEDEELPTPSKKMNKPVLQKSSSSPKKNSNSNHKEQGIYGEDSGESERRKKVINVSHKQPVNLRALFLVSAKESPKTGVFGGLKNIVVTANNKSTHLVDLAVVEVHYILGNGKKHKTEVLYFHNIAPGTSLSKKAPNSGRGARVESRLTLLTSKSAEKVSDYSYSIQ